MTGPYWHDPDTGITLHHGDSLNVLPTLPDASVDAVVCDPPYEIGIADRDWDRTGIAYNTDLWAECLRVLKPGGHLLAFGHVRTYHRLAAAIEDAGFEIRDCIDWIYGQGYPGGKTQLKPAREPITVARRPFRGSEKGNIAAHGVGGLHVDSCRTDTGRWPANLLLGHSPDCSDHCTPGCPVAELDAQSGIRTSGSGAIRTKPGHFMGNGGLGRPGDVQTTYGDTGGASRYFTVFRFESKVTTRLPAGRKHITPKPLPLMRWLVRLVCPPGGTVLDWAAGSGTTLLAARDEGLRAIGIELHEPHARICVARLSEPYSASLFTDIA
ncbi:DNA-methyltransferase [Streptomyces caniscabiei]|uniref:DNA-methyltransferase n=1 Tax=Streptomyces caniscabiei TaxID=2746961 RepID=UPI001872263E|nr:site-specific DNA-methyltransferase [Streptomyces caniscabiei]MBE4761708.1 site-specific DNA-methyltransferase [Streptomyces caniscabiei]